MKHDHDIIMICESQLKLYSRQEFEMTKVNIFSNLTQEIYQNECQFFILAK